MNENQIRNELCRIHSKSKKNKKPIEIIRDDLNDLKKIVNKLNEKLEKMEISNNYEIISK